MDALVSTLPDTVVIAPEADNGAIGEEGFGFTVNLCRMPRGSSPGTIPERVGVSFMAPACYGVVASGQDIKGCGHKSGVPSKKESLTLFRRLQVLMREMCAQSASGAGGLQTMLHSPPTCLDGLRP